MALATGLIALDLNGMASAAPTETVIHGFANGRDGSLPDAGLVADRNGVLYGVVAYGGEGGGYTGGGVVFKLTPPAPGQKAWTEALIHSFGAVSHGVTPQGTLAMDGKGALYGVTYEGGVGNCLFGSGCGVIFKLTPPGSGETKWQEDVIYSFKGGSDGANPTGGMIFDRNGALYGTTRYGGYGDGTVFRLAPPAAGKKNWTETVLYSFTGKLSTGTVESEPRGSLIIDSGGALYGTTTGGAYGGGTVFKLAPPATGQSAWTETLLLGFKDDKDGGDPEAGLIMDASGALYGTAEKGGFANCPPSSFYPNGCGLVFKLTPPSKGSVWKESILHTFKSGADGANPYGGLIADSKGALYSTTSNGGGHGCTISGIVYGCGTIFKLSPPTAGQRAWTESILYKFPETTTNGHLYYPNGIEPLAGLVADGKGGLYGTANVGGYYGVGVVFELTDAGFSTP